MNTLEKLYPAHIETLTKAYSEALTQTKFDGLVVLSGQERLRHAADDAQWPLVPHPFFAHWLPLPEAEAALVMIPGSKPTLLRSVSEDFWHSPTRVESRQFEDLLTNRRLKPSDISDELPKGRLAILTEGCVVEGNFQEALANRVGEGKSSVNPPELIELLEEVRTIKTEYEIQCIGKANAKAAAGHDAAFAAFKEGDISELDLHLIYLRATKQDDFATPYKNIVALNKSASILHHNKYGRDVVRGAASLLIDAGATCMGYASDITRTDVKGAGSDDFKALISLMDKMQLELVDSLAAGQQYEDLHDKSQHLLANVLIETGLAKGSQEELVSNGTTRVFFPHGLGHSLGIQVHDVGCKQTKPRPENAFLRTTAKVEENMVFTIEPGCYFIDSLLNDARKGSAGQSIQWPKVESLSPFGGIRIEDDVCVRAGGNLNLTRSNWPA